MAHQYIKVKGDGKYYNKTPGVATRRTVKKDRVAKPQQPKSFMAKFIVKRAPTIRSVQARRAWQERLRTYREHQAALQAAKQAEEFGCRRITVYKNAARDVVDKQKREVQLRLLLGAPASQYMKRVD